MPKNEEIINLTHLDNEEPWCTECSRFTDYRKKWSSSLRADLDGGSYTQNEEIPHCVICNSRMYFLGTCRWLLWGVRLLCMLAGVVSSLLCFLLFSPTMFSVSCWLLSILVLLFVAKLPVQSRLALRQIKKL